MNRLRCLVVPGPAGTLRWYLLPAYPDAPVTPERGATRILVQ
jgi:hypothetical protein